jgi:hypothetical protein
MEEDNPVGTLLGVVLGTTEWLILGFWLGIKEEDSVRTSTGAVLGTAE